MYWIIAKDQVFSKIFSNLSAELLDFCLNRLVNKYLRMWAEGLKKIFEFEEGIAKKMICQPMHFIGKLPFPSLNFPFAKRIGIPVESIGDLSNLL